MSIAPTCPRAPTASSSLDESVSAEVVAATARRPSNRQLKAGAAWVTVGRFLGVAVTMLVNVVLARCLTPAEFGEFLVISSVLGTASLLAMFGMNSAVVRFVPASLGENDVARARQSLRLIVLATLVSIASAGALAAVLLATLDTSEFGVTLTAGLAPMIVASLMLLAMLQFLGEACRSLQELRLATLLSGGQTGGLLSNVVFLTLIAGAMVTVRPALLTAVALNLAAMVVTLPVAIVGLSRAARQRLVAAPSSLPPRRRLARASLLTFALPMLLVQLLTSATAQGDLWIAGGACSPDEVALYGAARRLMLLIAMPLQVINFMVIASIAELYSQHRLEELERLLRGAATISAAVSISAGLFLICFGGPTLSLLFGPYFHQAAPLLAILATGQLFLACAGSCDCALSMTGHQFAALAVNLLSGLALAVFGIWAVRNFGSLGLAAVSAAVVAAQSVCLWLLARKLVGVWTHPAWRPISLTV